MLTPTYLLLNTTLVLHELNVTPTNGSLNETKCVNRLPSTQDFIENLSPSDIGLGVSCIVMTIMLVMLYIEEVVMLKLTYADKEERLKVMCLLGIYPVFSSCALCGLVVPRSFPMTEFISTLYLSTAMFIFQRMIVLFIDGESNLVRVFHNSTLPLAVPPLCCVCPWFFRKLTVKVTLTSVITVRLFVLQGAIIRPILAFSFAVFYLNKGEQPSNKSLVTALNILKTLSMMLAMYGLQIIYRLTRTHLQTDLGQKRILGKFVCFQLVIVFGIVQPNIFHFLEMGHIPPCSPPYGSKVLSLRLSNTVQIFEMFIIAILARCIYHPNRPEGSQAELPDPQYDINGSRAIENPALNVSTPNLSQISPSDKNQIEDIKL